MQSNAPNPSASPLRSIIRLGVIALVGGLVMGLLGGLAVQPKWWSIIPAVAGPAALVVLDRQTGSDHIQPWPWQTTLAAAGVLALGLLIGWIARQRAPRPVPA